MGHLVNPSSFRLGITVYPKISWCCYHNKNFKYVLAKDISYFLLFRAIYFMFVKRKGTYDFFVNLRLIRYPNKLTKLFLFFEDDKGEPGHKEQNPRKPKPFFLDGDAFSFCPDFFFFSKFTKKKKGIPKIAQKRSYRQVKKIWRNGKFFSNFRLRFKYIPQKDLNKYKKKKRYKVINLNKKRNFLRKKKKCYIRRRKYLRNNKLNKNRLFNSKKKTRFLKGNVKQDYKYKFRKQRDVSNKSFWLRFLKKNCKRFLYLKWLYLFLSLNNNIQLNKESRLSGEYFINYSKLYKKFRPVWKRRYRFGVILRCRLKTWFLKQAQRKYVLRYNLIYNKNKKLPFKGFKQIVTEKLKKREVTEKEIKDFINDEFVNIQKNDLNEEEKIVKKRNIYKMFTHIPFFFVYGDKKDNCGYVKYSVKEEENKLNLYIPKKFHNFFSNKYVCTSDFSRKLSDNNFKRYAYCPSYFWHSFVNYPTNRGIYGESVQLKIDSFQLIVKWLKSIFIFWYSFIKFFNSLTNLATYSNPNKSFGITTINLRLESHYFYWPSILAIVAKFRKMFLIYFLTTRELIVNIFLLANLSKLYILENLQATRIFLSLFNKINGHNLNTLDFHLIFYPINRLSYQDLYNNTINIHKHNNVMLSITNSFNIHKKIPLMLDFFYDKFFRIYKPFFYMISYFNFKNGINTSFGKYYFKSLNILDTFKKYMNKPLNIKSKIILKDFMFNNSFIKDSEVSKIFFSKLSYFLLRFFIFIIRRSEMYDLYPKKRAFSKYYFGLAYRYRFYTYSEHAIDVQKILKCLSLSNSVLIEKNLDLFKFLKVFLSEKSMGKKKFYDSCIYPSLLHRGSFYRFVMYSWMCSISNQDPHKKQYFFKKFLFHNKKHTPIDVLRVMLESFKFFSISEKNNFDEIIFALNKKQNNSYYRGIDRKYLIKRKRKYKTLNKRETAFSFKMNLKSSPYTRRDAFLNADFIGTFIKRGCQNFDMYSTLLVLRKELNKLLENGFLFGYCIKIKGRFTKGRRSRVRLYNKGSVKYSTISIPLEYHETFFITENGLAGVKIWLHNLITYNRFYARYRLLRLHNLI